MIGILGAVLLPCLSALADGPSSSPAACALTEADKAANAKLGFDDFDQKGTSPATWRRLSDRQCHEAAIEAAEDYLIHAGSLSDEQRRDVIFHLAQSLGEKGDYTAAALMVAAAKQASATPVPELNWNTYLDGTWAFFKRDRAALEAAQRELTSEAGRADQINGSALTGLLNCFEQPYAVAYGQECRGSLSQGR